MKAIDLTGQRFGKLTVIEKNGKKGKDSAWLCICKCGNKCVVSTTNLKNGHSSSCGCLRKENIRQRATFHGLSFTPLYYIWGAMMQRCTNPRCKAYQHYGARGIKICEDWRNFKSFYNWAIPAGYREGLSIERIDVNGDYCPQNCKWIYRAEQQKNKRNNHLITHEGKTQTISQWAEEYNIPYARLYARITKYNWSIEKALNTK